MQNNSKADNNNSNSNRNISYQYTGKVNTNFSVRNSTILFETQNPDEYRNSQIVFLAKLNSEYRGAQDNEISVRWSTDRHYGDNIVQCFDVGFNLTNGKTRIRYEHQHPSYTDALATGQTPGTLLSTDAFVAFKFIKLDDSTNSSTLFQVLQMTEDNEWTELFNHKETDHYVDEYSQGCQIAIKVKDYTENVILKDIAVKEIEPLPPYEPA